jgi:predicted Zn-dependent peptidase
MASILGGGFTSRINMNIREDKGFAYGARAGFSYNRHHGVFAATSSVHTEKTGASLREIAKEIGKMRTTDVTEEELSREKNAILLGMPARFASASRVMRSFSNLVFYGLPLDYYDGFQERIRSATAADLRKVAEKHLRESDFKVLVVGDGAVIREDLEAIAKEGVLGGKGLVVLDEDGKVQ